ncbi:MAG: UDP-N-acetylglucosamine 4,6-dehydratase (inverting) [Candidatus Omnitrophota bacterium]
MLNGKSILVTGGTGSFGKKFIQMTLAKFSPQKLIVLSRDEMKQWDMQKEFAGIDKKGILRYFIGDVRDRDRLNLAFQEVDYVIHAAATKIVPTAEYNPFETIKTNVLGAMNVIESSIAQKVKRVIALSTDKACNPINLYGATKLCSDKLFVAGNAYAGIHDIRFAVVRYGNVMGSRGSVIPFFIEKAKTGEIPITDARMTRFMITLEQAVELVWLALGDCVGGEIYIPKIPSMKVVDIAGAVSQTAKQAIIGVRPGEKLHEFMIGEDDARHAYEYDAYFKILPDIYNWHNCSQRIGQGKKCTEGFSYSSANNQEWMTQEQLQVWLKNEYPDYDTVR